MCLLGTAAEQPQAPRSCLRAAPGPLPSLRSHLRKWGCCPAIHHCFPTAQPCSSLLISPRTTPAGLLSDLLPLLPPTPQPGPPRFPHHFSSLLSTEKAAPFAKHPHPRSHFDTLLLSLLPNEVIPTKLPRPACTSGPFLLSASHGPTEYLTASSSERLWLRAQLFCLSCSFSPCSRHLLWQASVWTPLCLLLLPSTSHFRLVTSPLLCYQHEKLGAFAE